MTPAEKKIILALTEKMLMTDDNNVIDKINFLLKHLRRPQYESFH